MAVLGRFPEPQAQRLKPQSYPPQGLADKTTALLDIRLFRPGLNRTQSNPIRPFKAVRPPGFPPPSDRPNPLIQWRLSPPSPAGEVKTSPLSSLPDYSPLSRRFRSNRVKPLKPTPFGRSDPLNITTSLSVIKLYPANPVTIPMSLSAFQHFYFSDVSLL